MEAVRLKDNTTLYEFGPFVVDVTKSILLRNGEIVPLGLKAFEILLVLLRNHGEVLKKDELLREVWPDTVVEENNLVRTISALRKALDEHLDAPQYIVTIPGRGYRFVADVREIKSSAQLRQHQPGTLTPSTITELTEATESESVEKSDSENKVVSVPRTAPPWLVKALILSLLGVTIIALGLWQLREKSTANQAAAQLRLWQLTFDPGLESEPAWSPDGRLLAYSSDRLGNFDIWVQPAGEGDPVKISNSEAHDWQPDWAPDGNRVVFRSERDQGGLFVVPVLGGKERKIASFGYRPRWAPDGTRVMFYSSMLRNNTAETPKVYIVGLDGQPPHEVLTAFLASFTSVRVAWHPDSQRISVWGNHKEEGWGFWTIPLSGGGAVKSELNSDVDTQLRKADVSFTDFQWAANGQSLYFEGISQSVRNLWKVEVEDDSLRWVVGPERITTGAGQDTDIAISRDGRKIAFTSRTERTRLWSLPFDATAGRVNGAGQPLTSLGTDAFLPDLSADGQQLVYMAQQAGKEELHVRSLKDNKDKVVFTDDEFKRSIPRIKNDGSQLAYRRYLPPHQDRVISQQTIIVRSLLGDDKEQLLTTPNAEMDMVWDWSRDGQWILGGTERQREGRRLITLFPLAGAPQAETQMRIVASHPDENLYQARFSPNQQWVSFCAAKAVTDGVSTIYVVPAGGGNWTRITEGRYFDDKPRWSPDGQILYFISNRTGFFNVWGMRFDPEKGQPLGEPFRVTSFDNPGQMILDNVRIMEITLSADRLILPVMEVSGGIWILENVEK